MISLWPIIYSHVALIIAHGTLLSITAQHTRCGSPVRYLLLSICFTLCAIHVQRLSIKPIDHGWLGMCVAAAPLASFANAVDKYIFRGWDYENYHAMATAAHVKQGKDPETLQLNRQEIASQINEQPRGVGTFWQVANVPLFDTTKGPEFVPERWDYLFQQSFRLPLCFVARMALCRLHVFLVSNTPDSSVNFLGYTGVQIAITWCTWLADAFMLGGILDTLGVLTALIHPSKLWMYRPLFGPLSESYSLRRFWGVTWHQNLRSWLEGWTSFISFDVLRLSRRGVVQRYVRILLSFALSGVLHLFSNMGIGILLPHWPTFWFFVSQGVGIMFEDLVIATWKRTGILHNPTFERAVGFLWVVVYMGVTKPWWQTAITRHSLLEDSMLTPQMVVNLIWNADYQ